MRQPAAFSNTQKLVRERDVVSIALAIFHELDNLGPLDLARVPRPSDGLAMLIKHNRRIPDEFAHEYGQWLDAVTARSFARGENQRRLRTTLWAEQCLRSHQRQEHEVLRAFNRDVWFVSESASRDIAEREAQVRSAA